MRYLKGVILVLALTLCITGCSFGKTKKMTCTRTATQGTLKLDVKYDVTYSGKYVKKVESTEKIISSSSTALETYKSTIENLYKPYGDVDHYDYKVTIDGDTLTSKVTIDYDKIDTDKLIKIDSSIGKIINNGKIKIADMKSIYEQAGATCEG